MTLQRKLVLLGSLYLAQGLPYGFFTQALPVLLREQSMALPLIGLSHLLVLPWALKFAWAPLIDRLEAPRFGRRRAAIVPLQIASCAVLAALAFAAEPGAMWALAVAVLLVNALSATQDIATDGLAVELLERDERGLGNGLQVGGYRAGMVLGGGLMVLVFGWAGWTAAFAAMAGLVLAASLPILAFREPPPRGGGRGGGAGGGGGGGGDAAPSRGALAMLREALARPGLRPWLAVVATYKAGEWFATGMLRAFLSDAGHSLVDVGVLLGLVGFGAALLGALVGGAATPRLGRRRALLAFGALQTAAIAGLALAAAFPSLPMLYATAAAEHFASATATAALFTAMMDTSRPTSAGTDYTVQASVVVLAAGGASALSGVSAQALGYGAHFLAAAGLSALAVLIVARYRPAAPDFALAPPRG